MIAASRLNRHTGCSVSLQHRAGVRHIVKKSCAENTWDYKNQALNNTHRRKSVSHTITHTGENCLLYNFTPSLTSLNSGRYLPACLMSHTGTCSTLSPLAALRIRSFCRGGGALPSFILTVRNSSSHYILQSPPYISLLHSPPPSPNTGYCRPKKMLEKLSFYFDIM